MPAIPNWLTTLQRVREFRRDEALRVLAQNLSESREVQRQIMSVEQELSHGAAWQSPSSPTGRVNIEQLRQVRARRDELRGEWTELSHLQIQSDVAVRQAQDSAAFRESDVELLRRFSDQLLENQQAEERRREEQRSSEMSGSLCNHEHGG